MCFPFSFLGFFRASSMQSGREARLIVPSTEPVLPGAYPPAASTCPDPTPRFDIRAPPPVPPAPPMAAPPIPPLRLEEIRQLASRNMEIIPIHYVQNNRFDGFVDIDDPDSLRDSMSRHSVASDRIISIENDRVDGVLEIDPESRNSIETQ